VKRTLAWLGGAAFVASLVYLVYFYIVGLATPFTPLEAGPARAFPSAVADAALFTVFALHHSLLARASVKAWVTRLVPADMERTLYVLTASALLFAVCALWQSVPGLVYAARGPLGASLYVIQGLGVLIALRGASLIDIFELAGVHRARAARTADALRTTGLYRLVRHPIYLGWLLMVFGTPTLTANRLLFAAMSAAYLILAIPWEERSLVAVHGDRYRAYQRAVRWKLVPLIW
jgi:hypothetical protein